MPTRKSTKRRTEGNDAGIRRQGDGELAKQVRDYRERLGLTLESLAASLGMSVSTVWKAENGRPLRISIRKRIRDLVRNSRRRERAA